MLLRHNIGVWRSFRPSEKNISTIFFSHSYEFPDIFSLHLSVNPLSLSFSLLLCRIPVIDPKQSPKRDVIVIQFSFQIKTSRVEKEKIRIRKQTRQMDSTPNALYSTWYPVKTLTGIRDNVSNSSWQYYELLHEWFDKWWNNDMMLWMKTMDSERCGAIFSTKEFQRNYFKSLAVHEITYLLQCIRFK